MSDLLRNASVSISLGIEDYQSAEYGRHLSAVRNFYAGVLLLAKEVLIRHAPDADPMVVIGLKSRLVLDGSGGVKSVPDGKRKRTIDFRTIGERFRDFEIDIDQKALDRLNSIRNDIEHYFTGEPKERVREAIGTAFPVVAHLFRLAGVDAQKNLGDTWGVILEVKDVYEAELKACRATFNAVEWHDGFNLVEDIQCPFCQSELMEQSDPTNSDPETVEPHCKACGYHTSWGHVLEMTLRNFFKWSYYLSFTDGDEPPFKDCSECGNATFIAKEGYGFCVYCGWRDAPEPEPDPDPEPDPEPDA